MSKTFTTPKGTTVPLLNLKGKDYLMGAYRLVWLNESYPNFTIETEFLLVNQDEAIAKSKVVIYDTDGKIIKSATATKRETKKDFPDFTEKAESSSIFRALAMLGMGTQFAVADLDEGTRLADSPLEAVTKTTEPAVKKSSFKKVEKKSDTGAGPTTVSVASVADQSTNGNANGAAASGWE